MNIDVSQGLVNGALGYVTSINCNNSGDPYVVWVKFDEIEYEVPIFKKTVTYKVSKRSNIHMSRTQFPLIVAYGITVHKAQGVTRENIVAKLDECFVPGMCYTALSRTEGLEGLHIIDFHPDSIFASELCVEEINRLRKTINMEPHAKPNVKPSLTSMYPKRKKIFTAELKVFLWNLYL